MELLYLAVRRELQLQFLAAVGLFTFGILLMLRSFYQSPVLTIAGLLMVVLGLRFIYRSLQIWKVENYRLFYLMKNQPRQIVWIYSMVTQRMPFGLQFNNSGTLYFKLIDGDEITVSLSSKHLKLVTKTLSRLLPHASFGYSPDKAQWYKANPEMLLRNIDRNSN